MQYDRGLRRVLTVPWVYNTFQTAVGKKRVYAWLQANAWRLEPGQKVLDIGCGTGAVLEFMRSDVNYVGFDISEPYIEHARKAWSGDATKTFVVGKAEDFIVAPPEAMAGADVVVMNGLMHHLEDDEAVTAMKLAKACLAPGGRFIALETTDLVSHARLANWLTSKDRGQNVRPEPEWKTLVGSVFDDFDTSILTGVLRIPYSQILIEARAPGAPSAS